MTIATDLGFEVGKEYLVVSTREIMEDMGIKEGYYVKLIEDDGSIIPEFSYNGCQFWASIVVCGDMSVNVAPKEKPKMSFTKKDLIVGESVVELRYGRKYLLLANNLLVSNGGWSSLDSFSDNLISLYDEKYRDIVAVYSHKNSGGFSLFNSAYMTLVWKREEETEQQKKIRELEETINKAQEQIQQLKKESK